MEVTFKSPHCIAALGNTTWLDILLPWKGWRSQVFLHERQAGLFLLLFTCSLGSLVEWGCSDWTKNPGKTLPDLHWILSVCVFIFWHEAIAKLTFVCEAHNWSSLKPCQATQVFVRARGSGHQWAWKETKALQGHLLSQTTLVKVQKNRLLLWVPKSSLWEWNNKKTPTNRNFANMFL